MAITLEKSSSSKDFCNFGQYSIREDKSMTKIFLSIEEEGFTLEFKKTCAV